VEALLVADQARVYASWTPALADRLHERATEYLDDARRTGRRDHELLARRWLVVSCTELGRVADAAEHLVHAVSLADELGLAAQRWLTRLLAAAQALLFGRFEEAERLVDESLAIGAVAEPATALDYVGVFVWTLRWIQGRLTEVLPLAREVATGPGADMTRRIGLVTTLAAAGEMDEARRRRADIDARQLRDVPLDGSWYVCMSAAADAARLLDDMELATTVGELLSPFTDLIGATLITTTGPVAHDVGVCEAVLGHHDRAVAHLRDSVERCDRDGFVGFGVRSRTQLARSLQQLGARDEAITVARTALDAARQLQAPELVADVAAVLAAMAVSDL
jgi:tetratricopeptide (TPR) repeat protein